MDYKKIAPYSESWSDFYLFITFVITALVCCLIGVVIWCVLLMPWCLYWLVVDTVTNGWKLLWSNGLARFFSK